RGTKGQGIVFNDEDWGEFLESEFWVKYKKKKHEFRVHIVRDKIIDVQQKVIRKVDDEGNQIDISNINYRIRNLENGFIFKRFDLTVPQDVFTQAEIALKASGLDFGAVDVIWNEYEQKAYVL